MEGDRDFNECESGWLIVQNDLSTRLTKPEQLRYALQCMGRNPSDKSVERYWSQCGGSMSYDQFCFVMQREKRTTMSDLMKSFRKIDINGDGYITAKELHRVLTKRGERMTHDEVQAIIDEADKNGDGKLDYAEFCHMLLNTSEQCLQATKLKAKTRTPTRHSSSSKLRSEQVKSKEGKHRSSSHRGGGHFARRERRREEIRSQLYPDQWRETHLAYGRQLHLGGGLEANGGGGRPVYVVEDFVGGYQNGFPQQPTGGDKVVYQPSYLDSSLATRSHQPQANIHSVKQIQSFVQPAQQVQSFVQPAQQVQSFVQPAQQVQSFVQPAQKVQSLVESVSKTSSSTSVAAESENKAPPTLPESNQETKGVEGNAANGTPIELSKEATPKPHPSPPPSTQADTEPLIPVPSKTEVNSQAGSLTSMAPTPLPSNENISDPFSIPSTSLTKLPPLKKSSLPPLLPPIGGSVEKEKEGERKELEKGKEKESVDGESEASPSASSKKPQVKPDIPKLELATALSTEREYRSKSSSRSERKLEREEERGTSTVTVKPEASGVEEDSEQKRQKVEAPQKSKGLEKEEKDEGGEREGAKEEGQTDHLVGGGVGKREDKEGKKSEGGRAGKIVSAPSSVVTPPPRQPRNIKAWNNITGKGCFYLEVDEEGAGEEGGVMRCHQYRLSLPSPTNVWIEMGVAEPGLQATDVLLFVFHTDKDDEPTELVTYTQHKVRERWISKLDLDAGTYALVPFTSGCHLKPREDPVKEAVPLIRVEEGGKVSLTEGCREALKEVFHRIDLDGNGCISRMEFDFFQERTSGESCDDDAWKVIQDNFEMTGDDEITLKGFLALHVMTAEDEEGGEGEVWEVLNTMGYNKQLQLDQACPFTLEVFTEDCEGEIEIVDLLPFNPIIDPALCRLVVERGVCGDVMDGNGELFKHTFTTPHLTAIVIENKSSKKASLQLDCSRSTNFVHSRDSSVCVLPLKPKSLAIGIHLLPENVDEAYTVDCIASKILC